MTTKDKQTAQPEYRQVKQLFIPLSGMDSPLLDVTATTTQKIRTAKENKEKADIAFNQGKPKDALRSYHMALMYLLGLDKNALQSVGMAPKNPSPDKGSKPQEKTEIDDLVEKIYANMSACHLKNQNWQRTIETSDKVLAMNENNYKAMFRKGKALGEQGFFEKARKLLEDLKSKNPADSLKELVNQEIQRLEVIDSKREKVYKQSMKGFLNKAEKKGNSLSVVGDELNEVKEAFIEELKE